MAQRNELKAYWRSTLRATFVLGGVWAVTTVLVPWLAPVIPGSVLGFPIGYWLAAQGALLVFVAIVVVCAVWMNRIDARHESDLPTADRKDGAG